MIYQLTKSVGSGISEDSPLHYTLKVTSGLVYKVEIIFPPGSAGLLRFRVYDGNYQVWPSTPGEYFAGDDSVISFDDSYLKLKAPFQFDVYAWNIDDTYEHAFIFRVGLVSKKLFLARFLPTYGYDELMKLIEEAQAVQEAERRGIIAKPFSWIKGE